MISLLLLWIYIFITTFLMGFGVIFGLRRILCGSGDGTDAFLRSQTAVSCSVTGLAAVTVFAQFWSLMGGVGAAANLSIKEGRIVSIEDLLKGE